MTNQSRRRFLKLASASAGVGAAMGMFPDTILKALAIPADVRTGTIRDVEHVIVLMQENRSFDHYFGTMRGVRGFSDPHPLNLPNRQPVWQQPDRKSGRTIPPFHLDTKTANGLVVPSLDHSWKEKHALWKHHDAWIACKTELTMGHFTREDMPFHFALADAFTICDDYHCSVFGPTNPNRLFLMSGTSGLSVGNDRLQAVANTESCKDNSNDPNEVLADWTTYPERLDAAGVSWKLYQEYDNFSDNALEYFAQYLNIGKSSERYRKARAIAPGATKDNVEASRGEYLLADMEVDIRAGKLPQVSWIVTSALLSEHPCCSSPAYGAMFIENLLNMLTAHPEIWSKTVLFINYDENDGYFDHAPIPLPAITPGMGKSTVRVDGENYQGVPFGLGARVPMFVVSPWSKGGFVHSELSDHTSVLRFLEARFGVAEPNISSWRRAVCGDLTAAFDFTHCDVAWDTALPVTKGYDRLAEAAKDLPMCKPPMHPHMLRQERGQRPARPLAYDVACDGVCLGKNGFSITFKNTGKIAACFVVYAEGSKAGPWYYTVGAGENVEDTLPIAKKRFEFSVHGPNGFYRYYSGTTARTAYPLDVACKREDDDIVVTMRNTSGPSLPLAITNYYSAEEQPQHMMLAGNQVKAMRLGIAADDHWYDLKLSCRGMSWRFAGHVETGRSSRSDPALG